MRKMMIIHGRTWKVSCVRKKLGSDALRKRRVPRVSPGLSSRLDWQYNTKIGSSNQAHVRGWETVSPRSMPPSGPRGSVFVAVAAVSGDI